MEEYSKADIGQELAMTQKSKPTIVDLLYMPAAAEIDVEFEKIEIKTIDETNLDELIKELSEKISPRPE